MRILDVFKRNSEMEFLFDFELFEETYDRAYMKRLALQTCIDLIARTIMQTEFRVRENGVTVKDEMYYRLNVQPNQNQTASDFWQRVIQKLIYDNECLIVQSDTSDLLIADDFERNEYAVLEDTFNNVVVKDYTFQRVFKRSDCIYIQFTNNKLESLVNGLYEDYGKLFGRIVDFQMKKNQVRSSMFIDSVLRKDKATSDRIDKFLEETRKKLQNDSHAFFPLQKGLEYTEHSKNQGVSAGVDEVNKVYDGFLEAIAKALGIPVNLLRGDIADAEDQTKNYLTFCIDPLLKKITDELNSRLIDKSKYLEGRILEARRPRYSNIFDVATAVDKLIASGTFNGNELRDELGYEPSGDPLHNKYFITKNYQESSQALEGGEGE